MNASNRSVALAPARRPYPTPRSARCAARIRGRPVRGRVWRSARRPARCDLAQPTTSIRSKTTSTIVGARPSVGSSSSSSFGSLISARATASCWASPPDRNPAETSHLTPSTGNSSAVSSSRVRRLGRRGRDAGQLQVLLDGEILEDPPALGNQRQAPPHQRRPARRSVIVSTLEPDRPAGGTQQSRRPCSAASSCRRRSGRRARPPHRSPTSSWHSASAVIAP